MRKSTDATKQEARLMERRTRRASILESDKQRLQLSKEYSTYFRWLIYILPCIMIIAGVYSIFLLGKSSVEIPAPQIIEVPVFIETTREVQIKCPKSSPKCFKLLPNTGVLPSNNIA